MGDTLKVLIVDEDPDSRVDTRKAVQRAQLEVGGQVGYGTAAVSYALATRPDIVLIAIEEPAARPLETAEALANALPETPFIVYSSRNDPDAIRRSMVFGAREYVVKPVQAARLLEAVNTVLVQEERRHMRRAGQLAGDGGRGSVITVAGAKGGIGKTVTTVNLGLALRAETGRSVVLVDADAHFGDVATMLDIQAEQTVADLLNVLPRVDRETVRQFLTRHSSGVDVLAASEQESWANIGAEATKQLFDLLAQTYDFVLVDTAGAFDPLVRACMEASTLTLVVTTGEVSSIRDTAAAVRRLALWKTDVERVKLVLNRGAARANGVRVDDAKLAIGLDVFWEIPYDKRIPLSVQTGRPVMVEARSTAARNFRELAKRIVGTKKSLVQQPGSNSRWRRLVDGDLTRMFRAPARSQA